MIECTKDCLFPSYDGTHLKHHQFLSNKEYKCYGDITYNNHIDVKDYDGVIHSFNRKAFKEHFKILDNNIESETLIKLLQLLENNKSKEEIYQLQYFGNFTKEDEPIDRSAHIYQGSFNVVKEGSYKECLDKLNFHIEDCGGVPEHQIVKVEKQAIL